MNEHVNMNLNKDMKH